MAWSLQGSVNGGSDFNKTAGSSFTSTAGYNDSGDVGDVVILGVASDNLTTTDGETNDHTDVQDANGNVYTKLKEHTNGQGAAAGGATISLWFCKLTNSITSGVDITITFSASLTAKAIGFIICNIGATSEVTMESFATAVGDGADIAAIALSGLTSQEYMFVAIAAVERPGSDGFTQDADYTNFAQTTGTTGGGAASNMCIRGGYRIFTGTGDTWDPTLGSTGDHAVIFAALKEATPPAPGPTPPNSLMMMGAGV